MKVSKVNLIVVVLLVYSNNNQDFHFRSELFKENQTYFKDNHDDINANFKKNVFNNMQIKIA